MTLVRFGAKCDGPSCSVVFSDYDLGNLGECEDCGDHFCPECLQRTGHTVTRHEDEGRIPALACAPVEVGA